MESSSVAVTTITDTPPGEFYKISVPYIIVTILQYHMKVLFLMKGALLPLAHW